jgi:hypothetical protein
VTRVWGAAVAEDAALDPEALLAEWIQAGGRAEELFGPPGGRDDAREASGIR